MRYTTHNQTESVIRVTEQEWRGISEPEERDCSPIEYLGIGNLPVEPLAEHVIGIARVMGAITANYRVTKLVRGGSRSTSSSL
jgi:hypothetical protein